MALVHAEPARCKSLSPHKSTGGAMKRHRKNTMKFNQSNRESDSLAVFYFKHSDTEPETGNATNGTGNDWSSQEANSEIYSDDDQWVYSNGNDVNGNAELDEAEDGAGEMTQMCVSDTAGDMVDCPSPLDAEKLGNGAVSSTPNQPPIQEDIVVSGAA